MASPRYRSQFGDPTFTKVFVGGLAWETPTEEMRRYFEQFGEILEAVVITDRNTGKSKGYGFVTFRDPESARRACDNGNPVIDGRRANCNIASLGRPRPSPPRGRNQGGNPYHHQRAALSFRGVATPLAPPPPPAPSVIYPPYGYPTNYTPDFGYHQAIYNPQAQQPQYYHQMYGSATSSAMGMGSPYYYGYSLQSPRGTFSAQRMPAAPGVSYLYYHTHMPEGISYHPVSPTLQLPSTHSFRFSSDSQTPQRTSAQTDARVVTSGSLNT